MKFKVTDYLMQNGVTTIPQPPVPTWPRLFSIPKNEILLLRTSPWDPN